MNTRRNAGLFGLAIGAIAIIAAGAWRAGATGVPDASGATQAARQGPVIATVNLDQLFRPQLKDFADRIQQFEQQLSQWDQEIAGLTDQKQKIQDDLETMQLSAEQRREKATNLHELEAQIRAKREILQRRAQFEEGEIYRLIYTRAQEIIDEVASEEGYDLVIFDDRRTPPISDTQAVPASNVKTAIGNRTTLYVKPSLDATDLVLTRYNNEFDAGRWAEQGN